MKRVATIAAGTLLGVAALCTLGAWHTGQRLPRVLDTSIKQANVELAKNLSPLGLTFSVELLSLDSQFFSTQARYRIRLGSVHSEPHQAVELVLADHIEHGPFPFSRLVRFKLMPVMASSHFVLERSPAQEKWFAADGESPFSGQVSLGYDNWLGGTLKAQALQLALDGHTRMLVKDLTLDFDSSAQGKVINTQGKMAKLCIESGLADNDVPLTLQFNGVALDSQTAKGASGFYLGASALRVKRIELQQGGGSPLIELRDVMQHEQSAETTGRLFAHYRYDIGAVRYQTHDVGSVQMHVALKNLNGLALQSLIDLYSGLLLDDELAQQRVSNTGMMPLSTEQQVQLRADLNKLLDAQPEIALDKLMFKTASGQSNLSLSLALKPVKSFDLPTPELVRQLTGALDAKVVLSKAMIGDIVGLQSTLAGEADQQARTEQALMAGEILGNLAQASALAVLDGDNIVSTLHYKNGQVSLNDKQMPLESFVSLLLAMGTGLEEVAVRPEQDVQVVAE